MSRRALNEDAAAATGRAWEREYRRKGRLWRGVRLDAHTTRVLGAVPALSTTRWLDAGCGDGKGLVALMAALSADAPPVVALDASRWALQRAREAVLHRPDLDAARVVLLRGDVRAPPLAPGSFGALRAVHVLGHLRAAQRGRALAQLAGLLAPGGWLVSSEFGAGDFRAGKGELVEPGTRRRGTGIETHYFDGDELERLVAAADLEPVSLVAESYEVEYEGKRLPRQRWDLVARRSG